MSVDASPTLTQAAIEETENEYAQTRVTRDGHRITYEVKVMQNPEKARACGQGAKSSTDRRPVDPPPIIQLRIYDEDNEAGRTDITPNYRANFFMWASLEYARATAHGRVARDASNTPILCGSPVSGISYLERPNPAGYFIFPDLSVRHEGRYRLSFTLYEDLKDPTLQDQRDLSPSESALEYVNGRCVVRSAPFMVYSAKKFPGLSESTSLSRTVAEQGCRVRIRRDVRMRKRETKDSSKAWASDEEEAAPSRTRGRRPSSPVVKQSAALHNVHIAEDASRPRSDSNVSSAAHRGPSQQTSAPDLNAQFRQQQSYPPPQQQMMAASPHPGYPAPPPRSAMTVSSHHPQHYDQQPPMAPQYGHFVQQHQPVMSSPQMSGFPAPPPAQYYQGPPQYYPYPPQSYGYMPSQQPHMASPMYAPTVSHLRHDSVGYVSSPQDYQAGPGAAHFPGSAPPQVGSYPPLDHGHPRAASVHGGPAMHVNGTNNPISSPAPSQDSGPVHERKHVPVMQHPQSHRQSYDGSTALNPQAPVFHPHQPPQPPTPSSQPFVPPPPQYIAPTSSGPPLSSKRSFASTFDTHHIDQRLQSGARPDTNGNPNYSYNMTTEEANSDDDDLEPLTMEYRRADGTMMTRKWPQLR